MRSCRVTSDISFAIFVFYSWVCGAFLSFSKTLSQWKSYIMNGPEDGYCHYTDWRLRNVLCCLIQCELLDCLMMSNALNQMHDWEQEPWHLLSDSETDAGVVVSRTGKFRWRYTHAEHPSVINDKISKPTSIPCHIVIVDTPNIRCFKNNRCIHI